MSFFGSSRTQVIKPHVSALTFHQFFEAMGLGRCITRAKFKYKTIAMILVMFFALTIPMGIAIGIGIPNKHDKNSPNALIVERIVNAT